MAKIIQDEDQLTALGAIRVEIAQIRVLDKLLAGAESEQFVVSFSSGSGKRGRVEFSIDQRFNNKISSILAAERNTIAKDIISLANKHRIQLDKDEEAILFDR